MKTFVTGATGHIGANLVRELVRRQVDVKVLVRPRSQHHRALEGLDVERVPGDLGDVESLVRGLEGCDRVYHLAAYISLRAGDEGQVFETNVTGTKNLLEAALRAGVTRAVCCSSFGAIGQNPNGPSDESWTFNPANTHLYYDLSKSLAELEVHRAIHRGLDAVIVNPTGVVGPYDYLPSAVGQTILDFARGKLFAYVPGQFEFVGVRDVVSGHILAMEKGKTGERYILSEGQHSLDEILTHLGRLLGREKPRLCIPPSLMVPLAQVTHAFMKRFLPERPPRFTPETIKLLNCGKSADTSKARRELGWQPESALDALTDAVEWFRSIGEISA